uniref:Uncharacterized protein n=1 Tax=Globodera rostochiensis TaxID=31243 RepID=A0A914HQM9_GLORO
MIDHPVTSGGWLAACFHTFPDHCFLCVCVSVHIISVPVCGLGIDEECAGTSCRRRRHTVARTTAFQSTTFSRITFFVFSTSHTTDQFFGFICCVLEAPRHTMKFVALFVTAASLLVILCVVCTARRAPMRLLEPNKYLIKRNFVTGSYHYKNLSRITEPQPVRRLRLMVTLSEAAWDNLQSVENGRYCELRCELEDENERLPHTFLKLNVEASINGYDENFLVRQPFPLLLRCRMRSVNGAGLFSRWIWTNTVKLYKLGYYRHKNYMGEQQRQAVTAAAAAAHWQDGRQLWRKPPMPVATYLGSDDNPSDESNEEAPQEEEALPAGRFSMVDSPRRAEAHRVRFPQHVAYHQPAAESSSFEFATSPTPSPLPTPTQGREQQQLRVPHWELLNRRNKGGTIETEKSPAPPFFLRPPIEFS